MFGEEILNGRQLCKELGISTTMLYRLLKNGLPYHQLTANTRRYYYLEEVHHWLLRNGYRPREQWTKAEVQGSIGSNISIPPDTRGQTND